ncbi:MAG TPA: ATP-binding protein, partial [Bacteroidales bacterium]|nr:ATP-binding protein [Bacteroidales bacterium]
SYTICYDDSFDPDFYCIPPMLLQPFVENAIEHGVRKDRNDGFIQIRFEAKNDRLIVTLNDNGVGMNKATQLSKSKHESKAIAITAERLSMLMKVRKHLASIEISEASGGGTKVCIILPEINITKN